MKTNFTTRNNRARRAGFSKTNWLNRTWLSLTLLLLVGNMSYAQVSTLTFTQSAGTYTPISGGILIATTTPAATQDDNVYNSTIPFNFVYDGNIRTDVRISTNGFITLGTTSPSATEYNPISGTAGYNGAIAPFGRDLQGGYAATVTRTMGSNVVTVDNAGPIAVGSILQNSATGFPNGTTVTNVVGNTLTLSNNATNTGTTTQGFFGTWSEIRQEVLGTSPNQIYVVQWQNWRRFGNTATGGLNMILNFQIRLYEADNSIEIVYGNCSPGLTTVTTANQVGLRGPNNNFGSGNVNNRTNTKNVNDNWINSVAGTSNTAGMIFNNVAPANVIGNGLTYRWEIPSCVAPGGLTVSATNNSANIGWNQPAPVPTGYEYAVTTSATPPGSGTATANLTELVTGLSTFTDYWLHVRSVCGGPTSTWSTLAFKTLCDPITSLPWVEDFESYTFPTASNIGNAQPNNWGCFTRQTIVGTEWKGATGVLRSQAARSGTKYVAGQWSTDNAWMFSPGIELVGGDSYDFSFWYKHTDLVAPGMTFNVGVGTTNTAAAMVAFGSPITYNSQTWAEYKVTYIAPANGVYFFGIQNQTSSGAPWYLMVDDMMLEETPSCPAPGSAMATGITGNSANITWNCVGCTVNIEYGPTGFTVGTGTFAAGISSPFNISGLTAETTYQFYLHNICGPNDSIGVGPVSFTTTFDACATTEALVFSTPYTASMAAGNGQFISQPCGFGVPGKEKIYSFTATVSGQYELNATAVTGGFVDIFIKDAAGGCNDAGWLCIDDINAATNINANANLLLTAGTSYLLRFDPEGTTARTVTFSLIAPAPCPTPTTAATNGITATTATLNWNGNPAHMFEVEYGVGNFTQGTGTVVSMITGLSTNLTGLTAGTPYTYFIRRDCNGDQTDYSNWSVRSATFNTNILNEDCSGAVGLTLNAAPTNVISGVSQNGPNANCSNGSGNTPLNDVWYSFVAPNTQSVRVTTVGGTTTDWVMEVWSGCPGDPGAAVVGCSDDVNSLMPQIDLCQFEIVGGDTYYVRMWTYSNLGGGRTATVQVLTQPACPTPPANNEFASATLAIPGRTYAGTTVLATPTPGNPTVSCDLFGTKNDVWYRFRTSHNVKATIQLVRTSLTGNLEIALYDNMTTQTVTPSFCNSAANNLNQALTGLQRNTDYFLRVWSNPGDEAAFELTLNLNGINTVLAPNSCGNTNFTIGGAAAPGFNTLEASEESPSGFYYFQIRDASDVVILDTLQGSVINNNSRKFLELANHPSIFQAGNTYNVRVVAGSSNTLPTFNGVTPCAIGILAAPDPMNLPNTTIITEQCGASSFVLDPNSPGQGFNKVNAIPIPGATGYIFRIYDMSNTLLATIPSSALARRVIFTDHPAIFNWNTSYIVTVAVQMGALTGNEGAPCTITIQDIPQTINIPAVQLVGCGTLAAHNSLDVAAGRIVSQTVNGAGQYQFRFYTDAAATMLYATATQRGKALTLGNVAPGLAPNTTYYVRVNGLVAGVPSLDGGICEITTANVAPRFGNVDLNGTEIFGINAYPNPFTNNATVIVSSNENEAATLNIYDISGRIVSTMQVAVNQSIEIGTGLAAGHYVLEAVRSNGERATFRLAKTK